MNTAASMPGKMSKAEWERLQHSAEVLRHAATEAGLIDVRRPSLAKKEVTMQLLYSRCAGLDVHEKSVSACVRTSEGGRARKETTVFGTFTSDLEHLREWLEKHKVTHVALESTGVFWIPVWDVLERSEAKLELVLINPQHVHALPGRKTDQRTVSGSQNYCSTGY